MSAPSLSLAVFFSLSLSLSSCRDPRSPSQRHPPQNQQTPQQIFSFPFRAPGCSFSINNPIVGNLSQPHLAIDPSTHSPRDLHIVLRDNALSAIFRWSTEPTVLSTELRLHQQSSNTDTIVHGWSTLDPRPNGLRWHEAIVCGLTPSTRYVYTVGGSSHRSNPASFVTAPTLPVPIVLAVITQSPQWLKTAQQLTLSRPDALLVPWGDTLPPYSVRTRASSLLASTPLISPGTATHYGSLSFSPSPANPALPWKYISSSPTLRSTVYPSVHHTLTTPLGWGTLTLTPRRAVWNPSPSPPPSPSTPPHWELTLPSSSLTDPPDAAPHAIPTASLRD